MYDEENIQRLNPLEHVRLRPGMYFGGTDKRALHNILYEVLENAINQGIAGHCNHVTVTLHHDQGVSVQDDGEGIPVHLYKDTGYTFLELLLSAIKGKYNRYYGGGFGGVMGLGVSSVNGISAQFIAEVKRDGYLWQQEYRQGKKATELTQVRPLANDESTGTTITFTPDFTVLEPNEFDYEVIAKRLRELAFLVKGLTIRLRDERSNQQETLYSPDGLVDFVRFLNAGQQPIHDVIYQVEEIDFTPEDKSYTYHIKVEFAFQYVDSLTKREISFANTQPTPNGGTHLNGFHEALHRTLNQFVRETGLLTKDNSNFTPSEIAMGLKLVLSIYHPHISFESQTKVRLINPEVHGVVASIVSDTLTHHPEALQHIIQKFLQRRT